MELSVSIPCPSCKARLKIKQAALLGKTVKCPKCGESFAAEAPDEPGKDTYDVADVPVVTPPLPPGRAKSKAAGADPKPGGKDSKKSAVALAQGEPSPAGSFRYDAFISYRHVEPDRTWARWLHTSLETFRVPAGLARERSLPRRLSRVFRDEEELPASADLSREIDQALQQSRFLIVVCSPRAPQSEWVNREVERFREMGRHDRILALLIEGEPKAAFPRALREIRRTITDGSGAKKQRIEEVEPLAADVRDRPSESLRELRRAARLRLLACVLGVRYDDLRQRDAERRRRQLLGSATVALAVLLLMGVLAGHAWQSNAAAARDRKAKVEADLAAERDRKASEESGKLAEKSSRVAAEAEKLAEQRAALASEKSALAAAKTREAQQSAEEAAREKKLRVWPQYLADIELMRSAWLAGDEIKAGNLLDAQIPAPGSGREDMRGIEWYFWNRLRTLGLRIKMDLRCRSLAISPDGRRLAGTDVGRIVVWDLQTGKELWRSDISREPLNEPGDRNTRYWDESVAFSPDGRLVAATGLQSGRSGALVVCDAASGDEVLQIQDDRELSGHAVAFSPDSAAIVGGGYKGRWKAWTVNTKKPALAKAAIHERGAASEGDDVFDLLFNPARQELLSRWRSGKVSSWAWPRGLAVENGDWKLMQENAAGVLVPVDSVPTAVGLRDGKIEMPGRTRNMGGGGGGKPGGAGPGGRIRDAKPVEKKYLDKLTAPVNITCLAADDQGFLAAGCMDRIVRVWNLQSLDAFGQRLETPPLEYRGNKGDITCVALGPSHVVAADDWNGIRVWPRAQAQNIAFPVLPPAASIPANTPAPGSGQAPAPGMFPPEMVSYHYELKWTPDPGTVSITDRGARKIVLQFLSEKPAQLVRISPHGRFIVITTEDADRQIVSVWDVETGKETVRLPSQKNVNSASFSADDSHFAVVSGAETVEVIYSATGERVASLPLDTTAGPLKLSPTGRFLAMTGNRGLTVFEVHSGSTRVHSEGRYRNREVGFDAQETQVSLQVETDRFLTFDLKTGSVIHTAFDAATGKQVVRSSDGRRAYVIDDGHLRVYSFDGKTLLAELPCKAVPPADRLEEAIGLLLEQWKGETTPGPASNEQSAVETRDPATDIATQPTGPATPGPIGDEPSTDAARRSIPRGTEGSFEPGRDRARFCAAASRNRIPPARRNRQLVLPPLIHRCVVIGARADRRCVPYVFWTTDASFGTRAIGIAKVADLTVERRT